MSADEEEDAVARTARACCDAAQFRGQHRAKNRLQLEADIVAMACSLRSCILWDYPQRDGAAAAARVASALREMESFREAACVVVDGTPVVLASLDALVGPPRSPAFVVLEGPGAPRWASPAEAAAYADVLARSCGALASAASSGAAVEALEAPLRAAGLSPASLYGWLLEYPCCYAFADGDAAARALSGGDSVVFQLAAEAPLPRGGRRQLAGHRFSVPASLLGAACDAALERAAARLHRPTLTNLRYVQQPRVPGVVVF